MLRRYFVGLPIIYLFFTVFILRDKVQYVYVASAILLLLTILTSYNYKAKSLIFIARWMITLSAIGLTAATILSVEKVELLTNPDHLTSCSLSPVVACSPVIASDQASAFGLANSFIGIFAFAAVFTAGITILSGADKLSKIWWRTLLSGILFGVIFSSWLIYQGVYVIGKLCLYCLLVWLVTYALLWLTTAYCIENKYITFNKSIDKILIRKYDLITASYLVIFAIIFYRWSDYWLSLI